MTSKFDEKHWLEVIKEPDWYVKLVPYFKKTQENLNEQQAKEFRNKIREFFKEQLLAGNLNLAEQGLNLDKDRLPIDTIVIHHTSHRGSYSLDFMEATQLLNIYAPHYADAAATPHMNPRLDHDVKGEAIWSGHFRNGRQTFLCYHWLMRMDGSFERLLEDKELGWHAGNWDINRRSVAICLDNDYSNQDPTDEILQKLAEHIKRYYPDIKNSNIIGHCECREGTVCPGGYFLDGWKNKLINLV